MDVDNNVPFNALENQARTGTNDSRQSISSIQSVSEDEHDQTIKHNKRHRYKLFLLIIVILIALAVYTIYGIDKYQKSKTHPQTKTILKPISSYDLPLVYACPSDIYGKIYPFFMGLQGVNLSAMSTDVTWLCIVSNNSYLAQNDLIDPGNTFEKINLPFKYKCGDLIRREYTNHSSWTILPFTQTITGDKEKINATCYALIPPKNYQFTDTLFWEFVYEPANISEKYFAKDIVDSTGVNFVISHQFHFEIQYNIIHPDSINDWYNLLKANNFVYDNLYSYRYATSRGYDTLIWCLSSIGISLYSRTDLKGKVHRYYLTQLFTTGLMSRPDLEWLKNNDTYIPRFEIYIQANTINGVHEGNGDAHLFHSQTVEYQDYGFLDFISGIGGIISAVMQSFGLIAGLLLTADYLGWTKWKGLAPYPSFAEAYQIRLRRLLNKEMKPLDIDKQHSIN
eukprot:351238_1